ncbi:MAG: DUF3429 domain-containing protein [Acetobacteraceae bacterium]|jgi:hypothetical protein|nr:DUF3429 domain-containing protein [Acetobacteraceae bacterium]
MSTGAAGDAPAGSRLPYPALWLGLGGLIPFAACTAVTLGGGPFSGLAEDALLAYGAVILAFLGAVHWGLALAVPADAAASRTRLLLGVVPSLIGWVALISPNWIGFGVLVAGFLATWAAEEAAARAGRLGSAYLWLRRGLTLAVVAMLSAVWITLILG